MKKPSLSPSSLSPQKYIRERARTLPIAACYVTENWKQTGKALVIVARIHKQGNYTAGIYLLDTWYDGLIDSIYLFNLSEREFREELDTWQDQYTLIKTDYTEAHNLIYGSIAFAEEAGQRPDNSFALTQYLLEEDTDAIPLIEYEFGEEDSPFRLNDSLFSKEEILETPYLYLHPEYPRKLEVEHSFLVSLFYDPAYTNGLPDEIISRILSLPHDSLVRDLEQITLFETGCTCEQIPAEQSGENYSSPLLHTLFFLGELRDENSLPVVLEVLRQNSEYCDFHFGDALSEIIVPTLYLLGQNRLSELMDYIKEPGLYTYARCYIFPAVVYIAHKQPERRSEIITWLRNVLQFYIQTITGGKYCDGDLTGMLVGDLLDIQAKELLPEIKALYATGKVNPLCCGDYHKVESIMLSSPHNRPLAWLLDIYERYRLFQKKWG